MDPTFHRHLRAVRLRASGTLFWAAPLVRSFVAGRAIEGSSLTRLDLEPEDVGLTTRLVLRNLSGDVDHQEITLPLPLQRPLNTEHPNRRTLDRPHRAYRELASRPLQTDGIDSSAILTGREPDVVSFVKDLWGSRVVDPLTVHSQPFADIFQSLHSFPSPRPVQHRTKANLEVTALGRDFD